MNKIFTLECKGEIISILSHNELGYLDFINVCSEIEKETGSKDVYLLKGKLIQDYGFTDVILMGGYEVVKRKGAL